jgi:hypothetical protein
MWSSGIAAMSGARDPSQISIVRRAPRPRREPCTKPADRDRRRLDRKHDRHPRSRARRREHEPRKRDPGHLRPGQRHDLAGEDPDERRIAQQVAPRGVVLRRPQRRRGALRTPEE